MATPAATATRCFFPEILFKELGFSHRSDRHIAARKPLMGKNPHLRQGTFPNTGRDSLYSPTVILMAGVDDSTTFSPICITADGIFKKRFQPFFALLDNRAR